MKKMMMLLLLLAIGSVSMSQGFAKEITEEDRQRMLETIDRIQSSDNSR